nr:hypothetical protein GCM10020092_026630 [Actinoplanes digitatis]
MALGATEFHYGLENDFGGVWLNTFTGGWRQLGYHALRQAYTGQASANTPPEITSMSVSNQTAVPAGGTFTVNAAATDPNGDLIRYNLMYSNKHITGGTGLTNVVFTAGANGTFTAKAPEQLGVWKVYVYAYDGQGNVGIEQRSFRVVPPTIPGTNLSRGRPATASSYQPTGTNGPQLPAYAVDGDYGTRWASEWVDTAWLQVDLGSVQSFNRVLLAWEAAYAKGYTVQVSDNGTTWNTIYTATAQQRRLRRPGDLRLRPLRPGQRHRPRHRVRLLALGARRLPELSTRSDPAADVWRWPPYRKGGRPSLGEGRPP